MRTIKLKPEFLAENGFEGHVEVKVPHAKEKAGFLKKLHFTLDPVTKEVNPTTDIADMLVGMIEIAEEMIISCQLKKGEKTFTKEDLFYDDHGENFQPLIQEIGNLIINGFGPSKK